VAHHTPLAAATGLTPAQLDALAALTLDPLPEDWDFPARPAFTREDGLVVDLAHFLAWCGIHAVTAPVHPRVVHRLRRRLFGLLAERFSPRQLEELVWRTTQCVAFNWHNDFFELDLEPGVVPTPTAAARPSG